MVKKDFTFFDHAVWGGVGICVIVGVILATVVPASYADDGNAAHADALSLTVATSCSMSSTVTSAHTATIANGTNQTDIGSTSLKVVCNDRQGWDLFAIGYNELEGAGGTSLINAEDSSVTIATGTATSGATSQWSMKLSATSGTYTPTLSYAEDEYAEVPDTLTKVASFDEETDQTEGSSITTTYQAYVSPTQAAGTYSGQVKYTLSHPKDSPQGITSIVYMQDMTSTICANSVVGVITTLIDSRDNKTYTVAKTKDGKCWMVDNLRYGGVDEDGNAQTMTANDSDVTRDWSLTANTPTGSAYTVNTSWVGTNSAAEYYLDDNESDDKNYDYYYNWYAAVAGSVSGDTKADATQSICPKGWTLPANGEYGSLFYSYGVISFATSESYTTDGWSIMQAAPLQFLLAGIHFPSGTTGITRGSYSYYWTSSSSGITNAYSVRFDSSSVDPSGNNNKTNGFAIRCVAKS